MATLNFYNSDNNNMWREYEGVTKGNGGFAIGRTSVRAYGALRFTGINIPQGTSVSSAVVHAYIGDRGSGSGNFNYITNGFDEDNTAAFDSDPLGRDVTSANHDVQTTLESQGNYHDFDVTTEANEIFARGGWSSGNAIGFRFEPRFTTNDQVYLYDNNDGTNSYLTITYNAPSASPSSSVSPSVSPSISISPSSSASRSISPSASISPSSSPSPSASQSPSPSASISPSGSLSLSPSASLSPSVSVSPSISPSVSLSPSTSISPSPSPLPPFLGMKIAKPGINVLTEGDSHNFIFNSDYGTLKYFDKQTKTITIDAGAGNIAGTATYSHNLGYYPYVEVFVLNPTGSYEYCPFAGSGATVLYSCNYKITTSSIVLYAEIDGMSEEVWTFDFLIFIYKNDLNL